VKCLLQRCESFDEQHRNYALNRWYNFWSAKAVEELFATHPEVTPHRNKYDKLIDFTISGTPFDHKTTRFPQQWNKSLQETQENPRELIRWLYENQSSEGRFHQCNRLFVVVFDSFAGDHWKVKAEIGLLKEGIDRYMESFSIDQLYRFDFGDGELFSDIIWVIR